MDGLALLGVATLGAQGHEHAASSDIAGYAPSEVLLPGAIPRGSVLPAPGADRRYVRDPDNRGWVVVPDAWITSGMMAWTTARNPLGQMVNQLMPPSGGQRGTYYNQPVYSDADAYGGTLSVASRAPMPLPGSAAPLAPPANYFGPSKAGLAAASATAVRGCHAMGDPAAWARFIMCLLAVLLLVWLVRRLSERQG